MKQIINMDILDKEITRKQFLQVLATVVISVLGLNNLISMLTKAASGSRSTPKPTSHSFGSSKFGA